MPIKTKITAQCLFALLSVTAARAGSIDVWDVAAGITVTSHSPVSRYEDYPVLYGGPFTIDIRDMFGGNFSDHSLYPNEIGNVRFRDGLGAGAVHWVEWMTPSPVIVESFVLHARGDGPEVAYRRSYSRFRLFGREASSDPFTLLFDFSPSSYPQPEFLSADLPAVRASQFRVEFTQFSNNLFGGPRIFELDGFITAVPEPTTIGMHTLGLLSVAIALFHRVRRGRRSAPRDTENRGDRFVDRRA